jgi:hypothetical protein
VGSKAERRAARDRVSAYHEACLGRLLEHVATAVDGLRAGQLDVFAVDEVVHRYHRAARELWTFCRASGGASHLEIVAATIDRQAAAERKIDWWERSAAYNRGSRS